MSSEWVPVVDTAIKIGLGALISGVVAYFISRENHTKEFKKELLRKKIEILESAMVDAQEYLAYVNNFSGRVKGIANNYNCFGKEIPDEPAAKLSEVDRDGFFESLRYLNNSKAKIRLLGIDDAINSLNTINSIVVRLRDCVFVEEVMVTKEELDKHNSNFKAHNKLLFDSLQNYFDNIKI